MEIMSKTLRYILFDLDETLYPSQSGLMAAISGLMSQYMVERLGMPPTEVPALREHYYRTYGTTLRGLQIHHGIDPEGRGTPKLESVGCIFLSLVLKWIMR